MTKKCKEKIYNKADEVRTLFHILQHIDDGIMGADWDRIKVAYNLVKKCYERAMKKRRKDD